MNGRAILPLLPAHGALKMAKARRDTQTLDLLSYEPPAVNGLVVDTVDGYVHEEAGTVLQWMTNLSYAKCFPGTYGDLVIDADAAEATRQKIEGYLAHRYGVTLDAGHPCASEAPTV